MIFSDRESLSFQALQQETTDDSQQMMYMQHQSHPHLHMQHQQHEQSQLPPHLGLSYHHPHHQQQQPDPSMQPDPFASSASNYSNFSSTSNQHTNRFQSHRRPNADPVSASLHHHNQQQQQQPQQLLHRGPYVSAAAAGYYPTFSQQMTLTALTPTDPRDPGERSAIASVLSSSTSSSSSSSPSVPESSPLKWTKAQDYTCVTAPTSAGSSLVFYETGGHVAGWNGEFSCARDALTSVVGATNNVCQQQQQQQQQEQQRRQQLFSGVGAVDDEDVDLMNVGGHRTLCLTGSSTSPSSVTGYLSHPLPDTMRGSSTRPSVHSIATVQQGYLPPSTHHHHLQPLGISTSMSHRSPQSQMQQISLGPQQHQHQGLSVSTDELRVIRGPPARGGGGGEGEGGRGGRMVGSQNQAQPPFDWMKKQIYPTTPSSGKTRTKDKYRIVYTELQKVELEKEFLYNPYITIQRKAELATIIGLSDRQVKIWFQNRRAKERKQKKKRPQATTTPGSAGAAAGTTATPTPTAPPPHHPSKIPRHSETQNPAATTGGAQIYPLKTPSAFDRSAGHNRGCSAAVMGPMKLEAAASAAAAAAAGGRALLTVEECSGEVKSESMAPL